MRPHFTNITIYVMLTFSVMITFLYYIYGLPFTSVIRVDALLDICQTELYLVLLIVYCYAGKRLCLFK